MTRALVALGLTFGMGAWGLYLVYAIRRDLRLAREWKREFQRRYPHLCLETRAEPEKETP